MIAKANITALFLMVTISFVSSQQNTNDPKAVLNKLMQDYVPDKLTYYTVHNGQMVHSNSDRQSSDEDNSPVVISPSRAALLDALADVTEGSAPLIDFGSWSSSLNLSPITSSPSFFSRLFGRRSDSRSEMNEFDKESDIVTIDDIKAAAGSGVRDIKMQSTMSFVHK